jgi:anti-sigma factor RsiW
VIRRAQHLHDDRLFDCYLAGRQGERVDPPAAEHLADCESCAERYAELARVMDDVRSEAEAETDAIFTAERLRVQHQEIARRLETAARPARVISFPGRVVRRTFTATTTRTAPRWAAAAAAAGLFVGIALGASYEWESRGRTGVLGVTARSASPARTIAGPAANEADEAFLSELDLALERPRTPELAAFDAFTPRIREISQR